jgi:Dyp-type peroxidase family
MTVPAPTPAATPAPEPVLALHELLTPMNADQVEAHRCHLEQVQGNIFKGHGRHHSAQLFLRFRGGKLADAARWIADGLRPRITTAWKQLEDARARRKTGKDGGVFWAFFVSAKGLADLGRDLTNFDPAFKAGLVSRVSALNDPPVNTWDDGLRDDQAHAMVLIADARPANVRFMARELAIEIQDFGEVIAEVFGGQQMNERNDGIEHFGYVDGRSQPLLLQSDFGGESDGTWLWNPGAGPALALVRDPLAGAMDSGSYFVFRKLEQNVRGFKQHEQELANAMNLTGEARELAGAMVVGRFEDGTPVTLSDEPMVESAAAPNTGAVPNNFNYNDDKTGLKCPFAAHIRKSNPRGLGPGGLQDENAHRMVRRGITYGERHDNGDNLDEMPEGDVGLLFMAYQANIGNQFEFIQKSWVNEPNFQQGGVGIDPVIGQGPDAAAQQWRSRWNDPSAPLVPFGFSGFVTMKGGAYLFAPSLPGMAALAPPAP